MAAYIFDPVMQKLRVQKAAVIIETAVLILLFVVFWNPFYAAITAGN